MISLLFNAHMAQLEAREFTVLEVPGSRPGMCSRMLFFDMPTQNLNVLSLDSNQVPSAMTSGVSG